MADDTLRGNIVLETNMGDIELELYWDHAPRACLNMQSLAERGYYDGCPFHRVVAGFAIQTGDPSGSGRGGESAFGGEAFGDEIHGELSHTGAGILSMANAGPDTNGSQFFITLAPTPWLDGKHTIFGRVNAGMHVVKRIALVRTDKDDRPVEDVRIRRARVTGRHV